MPRDNRIARISRCKRQPSRAQGDTPQPYCDDCRSASGGIGRVDYLVLFALSCVLLFGGDCIANLSYQFLSCASPAVRSIDYLAMSLKGIILKYVLLMMFVSALPPMLNLIGLVIIYGMMLGGGLRIFSMLSDMPSTKRLFHLIQAQYMKKKKLRNGDSTLNISTSSPLPQPNGVANARTP